MDLYTVGYEGLEIDEFTQFLKRHKIQVVADLRKNPVSRKRGFSKRRLAEALALKRIGYQHFPQLGTPTAWRKLAKEKKITRREMFQRYEREVLPRGEPDLRLLSALLREKRVALLCYEAEAGDCHRTHVSRRLRRRLKSRLKVVDLRAKRPSLKGWS